MFLAQMTNVDHLPPAAANARCSVCSSEELMHTYTAPFVVERMLTQASNRNASNPEPRLSFRIGRCLPRSLSFAELA